MDWGGVWWDNGTVMDGIAPSDKIRVIGFSVALITGKE